MPKTPSNKLYELIQSLSGSEKRYFKIFVRDKGDKNSKYIQLFDAMDAQETFDDEALRALIYPDKKIQSRKYSELKAYLYELILKSLQSYDEKTSVDFRLQYLLNSIKVLFRRVRFEDAQELLAKAQKLAVKYEKFEILVKLLDWEKQIAYAETNIGYLDKNLPRIEQLEMETIADIQNLAVYRNTFFKLLVSLRKDASMRKTEQKERLLELLQRPELSNISHARSHHARILYYRIYTFYYYATADFVQFRKEGEKLIALIESKPHFLKESVTTFISALSNLLMACILTSDYEAAEKNLQKLKKIQPITADDELKIHRQYYTVKFRLCINTGQFEEGLRALDEHFERLEKGKLNRKIFESESFYFQYICIYFGTGVYDKALEYLNHWLNSPKSIQRQDLQSLARIINLIIHYEMGNTLLLDSLIRSTYRFLNKRNALYQLEARLIHFIRTILAIPSKKERKEAFTELKAEIEEMAKDKKVKAMLQLFDLEAWLESKILNMSFTKVVKEKYRLQKN